ncbi:MAG: IS91 family transposase, partial [Methyloceanibacter sp.]
LDSVATRVPLPVLQYLGRYTHRTAIANERLVALETDAVRFRYKDYARGGRRRVMALAALEFLRRFALHVLPRGFMRIRHYGLIANRSKQTLLARARAALDAPAPAPEATAPESPAAFWQRIAALDIEQCPHCRVGRLRLIARLAPQLARPP